MRTALVAFALTCISACLPAVASTTPEALVYVSGNNGTYAYDAYSSGKLTPLKGSPFHTVGRLVGTNGKHFITVSSSQVTSYEIAASGAIGKETSHIRMSLYTGAECLPKGVAPPTKLNHAGQFVYVSLLNSVCNALQTFEISPTGFLTFKGASIFDDVFRNSAGGFETLEALTGNDGIGVGLQVTPGQCTPYFGDFIREHDGVLDYTGGVWTDPLPRQSGWYYMPLGPMTEDPTDLLAVATAQVETTFPNCGVTGPAQLASYTTNHSGPDVGVLTNNTWANMPTVAGGVRSMALDKRGKILAVATRAGVQFFHFNGVKPITKFTGIIGTSSPITEMAWDDAGHLYALNTGGKMHVFAVTTESVKTLEGSGTQVPSGPFVVRSY